MRGAAPGTRETDLLAPVNAVDKVHAMLLAGGSAFGLDAAGGVMRWLDERGVGVTIGTSAPTAAPTFTCRSCRRRSSSTSGSATRASAPMRRPAMPPATRRSRDPPAEGNVGAGAGASVGKLFGIGRAMKGGVGTASIEVGGVTVAALVAVNAVGDVIDPPHRRASSPARAATTAARSLGTMAALKRGDLPARPLRAPPARRRRSASSRPTPC